MNVTVLAGGISPEREVSLTSGSLIANALIGNGHRVLLLDLFFGCPELPKDPMTLFRTTADYRHTVDTEIPDLASLREAEGRGDVRIGRNVLELCRMSDAVFLALHGGDGENGRVQALLDLYGVPYTGSDTVGGVLAMDKDLTKKLLIRAQVPTPDWALYDAERGESDRPLQAVGCPCVVKPNDGGSSIGVSFAKTEKELYDAIAKAARYSRFVLVEQKIEGRELSVGVLGERVLPPVEIQPRKGFYDYRNKYAGDTEEICPAPLTDAVAAELSACAMRAFRALRLRGYARFDFLLDKEDCLWCLEANTLPGMTPTSLFPREAAAVGISYPALCEILLRMAVDRE